MRIYKCDMKDYCLTLDPTTVHIDPATGQIDCPGRDIPVYCKRKPQNCSWLRLPPQYQGLLNPNSTLARNESQKLATLNRKL